MTMKDINQRIKCWLEPKGFKQASPKSLFVKDQGFYFIVASLTPHKALSGFFFDLAVKFLWSTHEDISYVDDIDEQVFERNSYDQPRNFEDRHGAVCR